MRDAKIHVLQMQVGYSSAARGLSTGDRYSVADIPYILSSLT